MGFDPLFIDGCEVPLPILSDVIEESAFDDGKPIDHSRFSIVFNKVRGFAAFTAHNIDGAAIHPEGTIPYRSRFRFDPEVPSKLQVDNQRGYVGNPYDRGHLVRRRALHWGEIAVAKEADSESFYWTNIAPQHENLNRTAWARIEDWMLDLADSQDKRASVFTGPVLTACDPFWQNQPDEEPIQLPGGFWKIIAIKHNGELRSAAFLTWQRDFDHWEPFEFDPVLEQVRVTTIEYLSGLAFPDLRSVDPLRFGERLDEVDSPQAAPQKFRPMTTHVSSRSDILL